MRRQWISDVSHELRTPLAILRGEIEALQDGVRKPDAQTFGSLHSEVVRIGGLVDDLHFLFALDSQNLVLERTKLDAVEVLGDVVALFRRRLEERGLRLDVRVEEGTTARIDGNEDRLKQVFGNILENALRYADAPGTLRIRALSSEGELRIRFEDSGPGVPQASLGRLFDRLYRVDSPRSRESGGSGLGLAICKQIVEAFDGSIAAESSTLGGLSITIDFPLI